jgi:uncharacterized protein DUF3500
MGQGAETVATRMAEAARDFLDSLDEEQRPAAGWPFPADEERLRWYYTPTDHGGLPLADMRPGQQQLAFRLLATGLSRPAYVTACTIIGLENVLDQLEGWSMRWERERGRDPGLYYVRVFGTPGGPEPWSWRFGGHHVSVHHLVAGGRVQASTPLFLGADPAASPLLGAGELRPLGTTEDLGRELVTSLDRAGRERAVLSPIAPFDLVSANRALVADGDAPLGLPEIWRGRFQGATGELVDSLQRRLEADLRTREQHLDAVRFTLAPKGIGAADLSAGQRQVLGQIAAAYVGRLPEELAAAELGAYRGEALEALSFAWAGGVERGAPHYYRVQGPRLLLEYDNAQRAGNHAHSVWRDPTGDFGADVLGEHHAQTARQPARRQSSQRQPSQRSRRLQ